MFPDLSVTFATIKAIAGVAKEAGKIELYNDTINLQQTIMEAIAHNTELLQANNKLT
jgi:hypothetical protein